MKAYVSGLIWLLTAVLFAGCAATKTRVVEPGRNLGEVRRFFVLRNLKDNHGIEARIVRALEARGLEVSSGPITLLPDNAQAVVTYEDRWAWDFSKHMVYLKIGVRDPSGYFPYATVEYVKHVAFSTETEAVVSQLVGELLAARK